MRFYLDEDIVPLVARLLRERGFDAVSVHEAGAVGLGDDSQLERAAREGRCLVTRNRDDFIRLTVAMFSAGLPHHGVVIVPFTIPNTRPAYLADLLANLAEEHPGDLPAYAVLFLSRRHGH